jgi:hypothetical protein
MTHQKEQLSGLQLVAIWSLLSAPFALGIYLTLKDSIYLLRQ